MRKKYLLLLMIFILFSCKNWEESKINQEGITVFNSDKKITHDLGVEKSEFWWKCSLNINKKIEWNYYFIDFIYQYDDKDIGLSNNVDGNALNYNLIKRVNIWAIYRDNNWKYIYYSYLNNKVVWKFDNYLQNGGGVIFFSNNINDENKEIFVINNDEIVLSFKYPWIYSNEIIKEWKYPNIPQLSSFTKGGNNFIFLYGNNSRDNIIFKNFKFLWNFSKTNMFEDNIIWFSNWKRVSIFWNNEKIVNDLNNLKIKLNIIKLIIKGNSYAIYLSNNFEKIEEANYTIIKDWKILANFWELFEKVKNNFSGKDEMVLSKNRFWMSYSNSTLFSDDWNSFTYVKNENNKVVIIKDWKEILSWRAIFDVKYIPNTTDLYIIRDDNSIDDPKYLDNYKKKEDSQIYKNSVKTNLISKEWKIKFDNNWKLIDDNELKNQIKTNETREYLAAENSRSYWYKYFSWVSHFVCNWEYKSCSIIYIDWNKYWVIKDFEKYYESQFDKTIYDKINKNNLKYFDNKALYEEMMSRELGDLLKIEYLGDNLIFENSQWNKKKVAFNWVNSNNTVDFYNFYLDLNNNLNYITFTKWKWMVNYICK